MSKRYRVYPTFSPDVLAALEWEASQSGLAPTTLAASFIYNALKPTMSSRAFQAHLREHREPQRAADANEERRLEARMERAEGEQEWTTNPTENGRSTSTGNSAATSTTGSPSKTTAQRQRS